MGRAGRGWGAPRKIPFDFAQGRLFRKGREMVGQPLANEKIDAELEGGGQECPPHTNIRFPPLRLRSGQALSQRARNGGAASCKRKNR